MSTDRRSALEAIIKKQQDAFDKLNPEFRHLAVCLYADYLEDSNEYRAPGITLLTWQGDDPNNDDAQIEWNLTLIKYTSKLTLQCGEHIVCSGKTKIAAFVHMLQCTFADCKSLTDAIERKFPKYEDDYANCSSEEGTRGGPERTASSPPKAGAEPSAEAGEQPQAEPPEDTVDPALSTELAEPGEEPLSVAADDGSTGDILSPASVNSDQQLPEVFSDIPSVRTDEDALLLHGRQDFGALSEEYKRLAVLIIRTVENDKFAPRPCCETLRWSCDDRKCELQVTKTLESAGFQARFSIGENASVGSEVLRFSDIRCIIKNVTTIQSMARTTEVLAKVLDTLYGKRSISENKSRVSETADNSHAAEEAGVATEFMEASEEALVPYDAPSDLLKRPPKNPYWRLQKARRLIKDMVRPQEEAAFRRHRAQLEANVSFTDSDGMKGAYEKALVLAKSEVKIPEDMVDVCSALESVDQSVAFITDWYEKNKNWERS